MTLTVGSLFAGIGGFDLAAEWTGWRTIWVSEIDPYASAVLAHRFPEAPNLGDITKIDWQRVATPAVLCGGFPCQPHSLAGKRQAGADKRDLWGEYVRAIRELRPRYVVAENVPGLLTSDAGRFYNRVLSDLAQVGYDAEWQVLSAAAVGAPHLRERIWIVAYPASTDAGRGSKLDEGAESAHRLSPQLLSHASGRSGAPTAGNDYLADSQCAERWSDTSERNLANGDDAGRKETPSRTGERCTPLADTESIPEREPHESSDPIASQRYARQEPSCGSWWQSEPAVGRVAHGVPSRVDRLKGLGNAIVPQCAVEGPFRRIQELEAERVAV